MFNGLEATLHETLFNLVAISEYILADNRTNLL